MANLRINTLYEIEFQNFRPNVPPKDLPYVVAQMGDWQIGSSTEAGIVIEAGGPDEYPPILSATDARKLAKWLNNAADALDGANSGHSKKNKKRNYYEEDEDESNYKF